jgi:hypothetical protein
VLAAAPLTLSSGNLPQPRAAALQRSGPRGRASFWVRARARRRLLVAEPSRIVPTHTLNLQLARPVRTSGSDPPARGTNRKGVGAQSPTCAARRAACTWAWRGVAGPRCLERLETSQTYSRRLRIPSPAPNELAARTEPLETHGSGFWMHIGGHKHKEFASTVRQGAPRRGDSQPPPRRAACPPTTHHTTRSGHHGPFNRCQLQFRPEAHLCAAHLLLHAIAYPPQTQRALSRPRISAAWLAPAPPPSSCSPSCWPRPTPRVRALAVNPRVWLPPLSRQRAALPRCKPVPRRRCPTRAPPPPPHRPAAAPPPAPQATRLLLPAPC